MRVLWFTSVTPPATASHLGMEHSLGPASWVESLRQALATRSGLQLAIASPSSSPLTPFTESGVSYYGIPLTQPSTQIGRVARRWRDAFVLEQESEAIEAVIHDFHPDLIHVHGTENPFGLVGSSCRVPVVISLQGLLTVYERFYFHGMTSREIASLALRPNFALGWSNIHGYWRCVRMAVRERQIMHANRWFIGRTAWDRAVLLAVNPDAMYRHCDEVLRQPFYKSAWRRETAAPRVVFCTSGTMAGRGVECLVEALGILHSAGYPDVRLRIAGIPPAGPGAEFYVARARKHGVIESIDWLGRLPAKQLLSELLGATVFAYPSHIDNSPNALCEALLVGVPTVASYVGGIPSLIDHREDGLLYPDGDPFALAGSIRDLLDDPSRGADMGRRARERALRRHDPDAIVARLLSIYGELMS